MTCSGCTLRSKYKARSRAGGPAAAVSGCGACLELWVLFFSSLDCHPPKREAKQLMAHHPRDAHFERRPQSTDELESMRMCWVMISYIGICRKGHERFLGFSVGFLSKHRECSAELSPFHHRPFHATHATHPLVSCRFSLQLIRCACVKGSRTPSREAA